MDYALLEGLGAGLQQVGGAVFKAKFLDKLKEQETIRAEKRKEEQELAKVAGVRIVSDGEGVFWRETVNSNDDVLKRELAPKTEIDKIKFEEKKNNITLENLVTSGKASQLDLQKKQFDVDTQAEDRELKNNALEALVGQREASGRADLIRAEKYQPGRSGGSRGSIEEQLVPVPASQAAAELIKDFAPIVRQYTDAKDEESLTQAQVLDLAMKAIKSAGANGKDVADTFRRSLDIYKKVPKNKR